MKSIENVVSVPYIRQPTNNGNLDSSCESPLKLSNAKYTSDKNEESTDFDLKCTKPKKLKLDKIQNENENKGRFRINTSKAEVFNYNDLRNKLKTPKMVSQRQTGGPIENPQNSQNS